MGQQLAQIHSISFIRRNGFTRMDMQHCQQTFFFLHLAHVTSPWVVVGHREVVVYQGIASDITAVLLIILSVIFFNFRSTLSLGGNRGVALLLSLKVTASKNP